MIVNPKRIWVMFRARNYEFFRDRAAFGWNFLFPFLIVAGFGIIFDGDTRTEFNIGVFPLDSGIISPDQIDIPARFRETRYLRFVGFSSQEQGLNRLKHHKIDLLVKNGSPNHEYWVTDGPNGYMAEKLFIAAIIPENSGFTAQKQEIQGATIRYIDWLFPGILGMNMMFSALWGVGFVIVRYRKNGVLKRLRITPLTPLEYLSAQMLSRIFLLMFTIAVIWIGCDFFFHFNVYGSYFSIALIFFTGGCSLCSLGMLVAARGTSEEFASGVVSFISWPMMFLSEVWFSIEGAPRWIKVSAEFLPLTPMLRAARKVMNDGASLADVTPELLTLTIMTLICLSLSAFLFSWNE